MALHDNRPIYIQIADSLADDILAGRYPADGRIPSVREVAASAQVNVNTVVRAFEQLERDSIIYNRRGLGYFAAADATERVAARRREEFFTGEMDYFFSRLRQIGMSPAELQQRYADFLKVESGEQRAESGELTREIDN